MLEQFCLHSARGRPKLRIGVMLDSSELIAAFAATLEHIQQCDFAEIVLLIVNGLPEPLPNAESSAGPVTRAVRILRDKTKRKRLLFHMYSKYDRKLHPTVNDPLRMVDCSSLLDGIEQIRAVPQVKGFTHRFTPEDVAAIKNKNLDVILRYGFNILKGEVLRCARYGIWSYHHGDNDFYRGGPAHFWELVEEHPTSGVLLQVLSEELDAGQVLCKSQQGTKQGLWVLLNRVDPYWVGSFFVIRKLHELHAHGWEHLRKRVVPNAPYQGRRKVYRTPTNWEMFKFLAPRLSAKILSRPFRSDSTPHWKMAVRTDRASMLSAQPPQQMHGFRWIESPRGHYYADPFLFARDGKTWLFFEDYSYRDQRAGIACFEVRSDGQISAPQTALARPYHLSFPFVFEDGGQIYMIPETSKNDAVELYRAIRFPAEWELVKELFHAAHPVDTVLWRHDGVYWFFTSLIDPPGTGPQLFLFYADSLLGEWNHHPMNPISLDVRNARGAGAIFLDNGKLIRPSQDCSQRYGYSFGWNEIVKLSKTEYEERELFKVLPDWSRGLITTHTYNRSDSAEVVDGAVLTPVSEHTSNR